MQTDLSNALATSQIPHALGQWYREHARDLPWRAPELTPWEILLSEVMAQQTPVARVIPVWQRWLRLWPTAVDLAQATPEQVLVEWTNLGYPRRALRLRECAQVITEQYGGQFPQTYEELIELPGVGQYTAGAILAFAFGKRALVLDTNVRRVIARAYLGTQFPPPSLSTAEKTFATSLIPDGDAGATLWAQSSMELGATLCAARVTQCEICPIAAMCKWRLAGYPPDEHADKRKTQKFAGTDRQVRGLIMKEIRNSSGPVPHDVISELWPDPAQLGRCIDGLLEDGLIDQEDELFFFPQSTT